MTERGEMRQRIKHDVNQALDQAAGRVLDFYERREWWVSNDRFLHANTQAAYDELMAQAKEYRP